LSKLIQEACQQPTLADALAFVAVHESERAIQQAKKFFETGVETAVGKGWDTCFKVLFVAWNNQQDFI